MMKQQIVKLLIVSVLIISKNQCTSQEINNGTTTQSETYVKSVKSLISYINSLRSTLLGPISTSTTTTSEINTSANTPECTNMVKENPETSTKPDSGTTSVVSTTSTLLGTNPGDGEPTIIETTYMQNSTTLMETTKSDSLAAAENSFDIALDVLLSFINSYSPSSITT